MATAILVAPFSAQAYTFYTQYYCNGQPPEMYNNIGARRHTPSIPTGGAVHTELLRAYNEWTQNDVTFGVPLYMSGYITNGSTVDHGDGITEVALTAPGNLGQGAIGKAFVKLSGCWPDGLARNIWEADVMATSDNTWSNPDESMWSEANFGTFYGADTFVHEWGHAIGLDHTSGFNMMTPIGSGPRVGGTGASHTTPIGDDRNGAIYLYGPPPGYANLAASGSKVNGSGVTATTYAGTQYIGNGGSDLLLMYWTALNFGPTAKTFNQRIYLATSPAPTGYGGAITWANWSGATVNARNGYTWGVWFYAPAASMACNQYHWVFHKVDSSSAISELRENDNDTQHAMTIWKTVCP